MSDDKNIIEEPIAFYGQLDQSKSYTYTDYMKWQFDERVELIKGKILKMAAAPSRKHQITSGNLHFELSTVFRKNKCQLYSAPFDVRLPISGTSGIDTVVQPDLCVVCDEAKLDDAGCNGAPDLIVEILSPSNTRHDLKTKFELYEEVGVSEYWIVSPWDKTVIVYYLKEGNYLGSKFYTEGSTIQSIHFPDLKVDVLGVFEGVE
jgi:Uma2 family endonuclease